MYNRRDRDVTMSRDLNWIERVRKEMLMEPYRSVSMEELLFRNLLKSVTYNHLLEFIPQIKNLNFSSELFTTLQ